ncbi:hypothetical protein [Streptomyces diastaticus]|uniref:hypothetical protein n=1 Tax=Streptomyces diastaticus TaxID=1956 RepID=UPI00368B065A
MQSAKKRPPRGCALAAAVSRLLSDERALAVIDHVHAAPLLPAPSRRQIDRDTAIVRSALRRWRARHAPSTSRLVLLLVSAATRQLDQPGALALEADDDRAWRHLRGAAAVAEPLGRLHPPTESFAANARSVARGFLPDPPAEPSRTEPALGCRSCLALAQERIAAERTGDSVRAVDCSRRIGRHVHGQS